MSSHRAVRRRILQEGMNVDSLTSGAMERTQDEPRPQGKENGKSTSVEDKNNINLTCAGDGQQPSRPPTQMNRIELCVSQVGKHTP